MARVLNQNQRKWIEDNYDLVEKAVEDFAQDEDDHDEVESMISLILCESLEKGIDTAKDLREVVRLIFQVAVPPVLECWRRQYQHEILIDRWENFERRSWQDYSVDWDGGDFSE